MTEEKKAEIVQPHQNKSREVTHFDIERVYNDAKLMYDMIGTQIGNYKSFYAIAHQQIVTIDPLRFFLVNPAYSIFDALPEAIIVNPKIIRHTNQIIDKEEGCLSFATMPMVKVKRWNKCEVSFHVLESNMTISEPHTMNLSGRVAQVFQHEKEHFDCDYIYKIKQ